MKQRNQNNLQLSMFQQRKTKSQMQTADAGMIHAVSQADAGMIHAVSQADAGMTRAVSQTAASAETNANQNAVSFYAQVESTDA